MEKTIYLDTVDSTNTYLKKLALEGAENGTAAVAARQTAGKGRTGNSFESENGGLYLSVLLNTAHLSVPETTAVTTCAAVAAIRTLRETCGIKAGIKWVNDIIYNEGKLGGILTEAGKLQNGRIPYVVVGIGINLNQRSFPDGIAGTAVSLRNETGREYPIRTVAESLIEGLRRIGEDAVTEKSRYLREYREACITLGRTVVFERNGGKYSALASELTDDCGLLVKYTDGSEEILRSGEVHIRGIAGYI